MTLLFNLFRMNLILVVLFLGVSCVKPTEDPKGLVSPSQRKLENLAIYPHTEAFKTSREHGQTYLSSSKDCAVCHSLDQNSPSGIKGATSCVTCHKVFPHTEDFKKTNKHGNSYIENTAVCATCHNSKETQVKTVGATSCVSCHKDYPHDSDFKSTHNHGLKFYENGTQCIQCHKPLVEGVPQKATACISCHKIYPHTNDFKYTNVHGMNFYENKKECEKCHKAENVGVANSPKICSTCHQGFPHSEEFKSSTHGSFFLKDRTNCTKCHGTDFKGGTLKVACLDCHSFPHSTAWAYPKNHGSKFEENSDMVGCLNCHSETSEFKKRHPENFVSCGTCHISLPHAQEFKDGDHVSQAQSYSGKCTVCHTDGKRLLPNVGTCNSCHGDDQTIQIKWAPKPTQVKFKAK